ncbi:S-layer homology domain-containing protein [Paenibacillus sp. PL91]|uniref:S-layer homology domain-containing protein n=1 Tax=Paenibacillus sp. PL91 TaxID=2729538 RepID=UPI00145FC356|nr:S-layer homology domain-containing protein [Paenibacillus sp. PL91]MBC9201494.1 S-layer homology domain-containing protein [Paenibacillus sp. PL91]
MESRSVRMKSRKQNRLWGKKSLALFMAIAILLVQLLPVPYFVNAAGTDTGATYFTGMDNWKGGAADSTADNDMDKLVGNEGAESANVYPIEFKIKDVKAKPTKSAYMLVRAYDVDEYDEANKSGTGEWDRVYFSSQPEDIALAAPTTPWRSTGFGSATYKKEFSQAFYLGALSGKDSTWNTTVIEIKADQWDRIAANQDQYVGISVHHYFDHPNAKNDWVTNVDWGQLVIDGGIKQTGEITGATVAVGTNKITIDTGFLPKEAGDFYMEVNVIQKTQIGTKIVDQNVDLEEKSFLNAKQGEPNTWGNIELSVPGADPNKDYTVNIMLFDKQADKAQPGTAQHIYSLSTLDPAVKDMAKTGLQYEPTTFALTDFSSKYYRVTGQAQPTKLEKVKIVTLPSGGTLKLLNADVALGDEIAKADLANLTFVPAAEGFTGSASFDWNGYDGTKYAAIDAKVTITANAAPVVANIAKMINQGETLALGATDFTSQYTDATTPSESLSRVKITSLPDPALGKLWIKTGSNPAVAVTVGSEISAADLGKLIFVPANDAVGAASFQWNGSDGKQYAKDAKTVTITINAAPVVSDISFAAIAGTSVSLKATDFANPKAYADEENEALTKVRITLPANFANSGKLIYTLAGIETQVVSGTVITITDLNSLRFVPALNLAEESTVLFDWEGYDGNQYSLAPAKASITYTNDPVVSNIAKTGLQYDPTSFQADEFKSHYSKANGASNANELKLVKIVTLPAAEQGELFLNDEAVAAGDEIAIGDIAKLTFVPASSGFTGTAAFGWNGENGQKYAALSAAITITANAAPTVDPINKSILKGETVPFKPAGFASAYSDSDHESIDKVKLVTLPDPGKGQLVLQLGDGPAMPITTPGFEIKAAELSGLTFIPASGATGSVTFDWSGSDGKQYAKDNKKITININTPPVVGDIIKAGLSGRVIDFKTIDFTESPRFTDADGDLLSTVIVTLPAHFEESGTLWYTSSVGESVYVEQGSAAPIAKNVLASLKFQPSVHLAEGSTVEFEWSASDGKQYAEAPGRVLIAYNGMPVAEPITANVEEGTTEIIITFKGTDMETVTELVYGLESNPGKGSLRPADDDVSGDTWIYTPDPDFISGQDSFMYSVTDQDGQTSAPATVTINIHRALDGWVGDKAQGDSTVFKIIPGEQLKLGAVSSLLAEKVYANVNGIRVPLTLVNQDSFELDGYKKWENTTYLLPEVTVANQYQVDFTAVDVEGGQLAPEIRLLDNDFELLKADLQLTASPENILGDGKSSTELSAVLTNADGSPIAGVNVIFTAPVDKGEFVGGNTAVTDEQGIARVTYKSEKIMGVDEQLIPIRANVYDKALGLKAQDVVTITFLPAAVKGFITKGSSNMPVAGASVRVTLDLDGDGMITAGVDFDQTIVTDESGAYYVVVPKGDVIYDLDVTQSVYVGGVATPVTYKQTAQVGEVTGSVEENFDSEKTVTGIVLLKQPDGKSSLFGGELLAKTTIYLKQADGSYVSEAGAPKAFALNGQGVFNADGLAIGEYELEIKYEVEPGKAITFSRTSVSVTASGEMNISEALVDPYGTITDSVTKAVIEGATVVLHYADTFRNKGKGITPGAKVTLPALVGFAPNDNASPEQLSDAFGFYAYMVYPETDYYLAVTKNGYQSYFSPILSVEWEIVRHDLELIPVAADVQAAPSADPTLTLSIDKNKVKEGTKSTVSVEYKNASGSALAAGEIKVTIPAGAVIVDAAGGIVNGNSVVWKVTNVLAGQSGGYKLVIEWPLMKAADTAFDIPGELLANGTTIKSSVKINVYSERFGELAHYRYILGYPDKEFKPEGSLTRAELAAIVARLTENEDVNYPMSYNDIRKDHWATNYIEIATKNKYFSGYEDGSFRPDASVTRGELASVMARFLKLEVSAPATTHFKDTTGHWAADTIEALYNGKFLTGYPDGSFKPTKEIVRVEAVTMINRMLYRGPLQGLDQQFPDMPQNHWGFGDVQEATISHSAKRKEDGSEKWIANLSDDVK